MARVTVEDCVLRIPNRFELVMMASQRARNISRGDVPTVDRDNDKNPVVALREIADGTVEIDALQADLIKGLQRVPEPEPATEEVLDLLPNESNIFAGMDVGPEEQLIEDALPEAASEDDIEAAIARELGGG